MLVIGLVGGVASGKSLVARQLAELGAGILDGDGAGHRVLQTSEVEAAARRRWGPSIFGPDGRIVRSALARIVFGKTPEATEELKHLEHLTHPRIGELLRVQAAELAAAGTPAAVLDAPVLLKAGWDTFCDRILFVDAPREVRLARARQRGWSEEEFAAREAAQESLTEKHAHADATIDNSGSAADTAAQVNHFWKSLGLKTP